MGQNKNLKHVEYIFPKRWFLSFKLVLNTLVYVKLFILLDLVLICRFKL